jgi:hypothetical protein
MMFVPSPISMLIFFSPQALLVFAIKKKALLVFSTTNKSLVKELSKFFIFLFK